MFSPLFTRLALFALPAKFNSFLLHCTGDEGAADGHSPVALTAPAAVLCVDVVPGAEPAGEATDPNLGILYFHS